MDKDEEETIEKRLGDLEYRLTNIEMGIDDFEDRIVKLERKK